MIELREYQKLLFERGLEILRSKGLVYIAAEERTGKTPISLKIAESYGAQNVLVLTKKKALEGWEGWRDKVKTTLHLFNYEKREIPQNSYDLAILDESHFALSGYPKPSQTAIKVQKIVYNLPIIFLSATPSAQSLSLLFHQLNMSSKSPWGEFRNFYYWHKRFGVPKLIRGAGGVFINDYSQTKEDDVKASIEPYFLYLTRKEANFKEEPNDEIVEVELGPHLTSLLNSIQKGKVFLPVIGDYTVNSISRELKLCHMVESGVCSVIDTDIDVKQPYIDLDTHPKVDYILNRWGDNDNFAIFYEYKCEGEMLKKHFKKALILQGTSYAEGVDLSHLDFSVVLSQNFSTSKYIQRRARLCGYSRDKIIKCYFLIGKRVDGKPSISQHVYNTVAIMKENFTDSLYRKFKESLDSLDS